MGNIELRKLLGAKVTSFVSPGPSVTSCSNLSLLDPTFQDPLDGAPVVRCEAGP